MKIRIEERSDEVLFFLEAESIPDAAQLVRIGASVVGDASAFVNFSATLIGGWVCVPFCRKKKTSIMSGKKK